MMLALLRFVFAMGGLIMLGDLREKSEKMPSCTQAILIQTHILLGLRTALLKLGLVAACLDFVRQTNIKCVESK